jgi:hypothetical protein
MFRSPVEVACRPADTEDVRTGIELVVAILLPTALGGALLGFGRGWKWLAERRYRRRTRQQPIERLGADLRRLYAQLATLENQPGIPGKIVRVRALRAAYLDALRAACQRMDVAAPAQAGTGPVPLSEIYRVESALRQRGLDVRPIAT